MLIPPPARRNSRTAVAALSAAGLIALGAAPAAVADESAPELVVGNIAPIDGVKPGSSFDPPVTVANKGTKAADKAWVSFSVTRGLDYANVPSNCQTHQVSSYDEIPDMGNMVCEFDQAVEPGVTYKPEQPLAVKALSRALRDDLSVSVSDTEPGLDDSATEPVAGTAPAVQLIEIDAGGEAAKSAVDVPVASVNTADYQVTGADLKGGVGDTVALSVKFANAGPAWVLTKEGEPLIKVVITPPAGMSIAKPHGFCEAKGDAYVCGVSQRWVKEDGGETYDLKLKIDKKVAGAKGSVALSTEARPFDPDKTNDKADITLDVTGDGSTGSGGSSTNGSGDSGGGSTSGSTGGSDGSSTGSSDGGTSSTGGSGSSSTGGNGSTATDGNLAATGSSSTTLSIAAAAAAAVVVGAGSILVVRRRRAQG